LRDPAR